MKMLGLITRKTWELQLQMDFAFSFEIWQSLYVRKCEIANNNARFAMSFGLSQFICPHMKIAIENAFSNFLLKMFMNILYLLKCLRKRF